MNKDLPLVYNILNDKKYTDGPVVKIFKDHHNAKIPKYETATASGFDLSSIEEAVVPRSGRLLVSTGLRMEIPIGYEGQIRPRSGLAIKNGITVLNTPGTIDSDFRNTIMVILHNSSDSSFTIVPGMRIAQMVIAPVSRASIVEVDSHGELSNTERDLGGFGSTGV